MEGTAFLFSVQKREPPGDQDNYYLLYIYGTPVKGLIPVLLRHGNYTMKMIR